MRKHIKTIGNYRIVAEDDDDRIFYNVECGYKTVDFFTSEELAEQFIVDLLKL